MRITRTMFAAIFTMAFMQNAFAEDEILPADPDEKKSDAATTPAACASKPTAEEKATCLKQAADAVKAEQAKAADAKSADKAKPADKPKQKKASPTCPSAEEWQKLLAGKDKEIGELKAKVSEATKARNEFEAAAKKTTAQLAGANEEAASAKAAANEAFAERDAKVAEADSRAKDAQSACAASFEARVRAAESSARDAIARAEAAEAKAKAAEQALAAVQAPKPAPPTGGQPPAPAEPTNVPEDIRPCVERLVASRFHKGGAEAAIKRCTERILALRSGK